MVVKKFWCVFHIIIYAVIALIFAIHFLSYGVVADPAGLTLQSVTVDEKFITISGFNYGGMYNYRNYTTKYSDGVLCIKYSGGFQLPWLENRNSPDFCPVYNKYRDDLSKIYLSSENDLQRRLIWTKEDGELIK